ncbi:DUF4362 domain-containing protein [Paenibacillus alginolyticus]|uniref:DUF4362 domain-containing protein n=2 Tax=Paenibacillus alginolyticus TaxID=59839 RepID=A0ABT4GPS0_9BACL|nr:DUF4362 domain-containing protein [Paenibacillus alginolyticus]MCY9698220.1 DUF4362 domain-containing protein [Paenibacillus alginolyticus]
MIRTKITIGVLVGIIGVLVMILVIILTTDKNAFERKDIILHHFNKVDVDRLNEMVQRHKNGKGDYLMLIPPIIDGGYWIHDVHSNGREVTWTIDNTRDGMSSEHGKQVYRCKMISMDETKDHYVYTLNQCENEGEKSIPIFSLLKEDVLLRSLD